MQHMEIGATRLAEAIVNKQKIAIFGDYDVDGAVSSALMKLFISAHNTKWRARTANLYPRPHL